MKVIGLLIYVITCALTTSLYAQTVEVSGPYLKGGLGQAHTSLDTSNTAHSTYITSDKTNKIGGEVTAGYRFNRYLGAELAYAHFGSPSFQLTRGSTGEQSTLVVKNRAVIAAFRGFLPVSESVTFTARVGGAWVNTRIARMGAPEYTGKENQTSLTYGAGVMYHFTPTLAATFDLNFYPKITRTSENATDTDARMMTVGLQYKF